MRKLLKTKLPGILILLFSGLIFGCSDNLTNEDESGNPVKSGKGTVVLKLTDAPFPADSVAEANVTIDWIRLLETETDEIEEEEGDKSEPSSILLELEGDTTFNLLELSNGVTAVLTEDDEVPTGIYKEIRLHIVDAGIVLKDGTEFDLKVPGGSSSGLKIKVEPYLEVEEGAYSEVLLDFDVSRSFVMRGNMKHGIGKVNGFIFKPVVRAVAQVESNAGEISGFVTDTAENAIENAQLTLLTVGEDTITSAQTDEDGYYAMIGVLAGDYTLHCEKDEFISQGESVSVEAGEITTQDFILIPEEEEEEEEQGEE